jgi:hypothetical protein
MSDSARAPSTPPERKLYRLHPDDEAMLVQEADEPERLVDLSAEELAAWEKTGELPAAVEQRVAALGCKESRG